MGILGALYLVTLFVYAGIPVFNAPDERATAVFIEEVRETGIPRIESLRNESLLNVLHPRSTTVVGDFIVPIGFLGMPFWYGILAAPFSGNALISLFTPLLVLIALCAWYALMKKYLESPRLAVYATVLLATLPAFWYYAARGFMPNVPFVCLFILALAFFDLRPWQQRLPWWAHGVASGVLFGIAVSFRIFELPWILVLTIVYLVVQRKHWYTRDLLVFAFGACVTLAPIIALQNIVYGDPFAVGYTVHNEIAYQGTDSVLDEAGAAFAGYPSAPVERWSNLIFPFGIHERLIAAHVLENVFLLLPLFSLFALLGWFFVFLDKKKTWWPLAGAVAGLSVWLFIVYGSWSIADNPDPYAVTLANSYSRYWLPIYVLAIPFVMIGMKRATEVIFKERSHKVLLALVGIWVLMGVGSVLRGPDGFIATRMRLQQFAQDRQLLLAKIPQDATVITYYADKYLYPDRAVVIGLTDNAVIHAMPNLLEQSPLYYFGITLPPKDMEFYQKTLLDKLPVKYELTPIMQLREQTLYRYDAAQVL